MTISVTDVWCVPSETDSSGHTLRTPLHLGHSYQSTEHVLFVAFFRTEVHEAQRIFIFQVMSNQ